MIANNLPYFVQDRGSALASHLPIYGSFTVFLNLAVAKHQQNVYIHVEHTSLSRVLVSMDVNCVPYLLCLLRLIFLLL